MNGKKIVLILGIVIFSSQKTVCSIWDSLPWGGSSKSSAPASVEKPESPAVDPSPSDVVEAYQDSPAVVVPSSDFSSDSSSVSPSYEDYSVGSDESGLTQEVQDESSSYPLYPELNPEDDGDLDDYSSYSDSNFVNDDMDTDFDPSSIDWDAMGLPNREEGPEDDSWSMEGLSDEDYGNIDFGDFDLGNDSMGDENSPFEKPWDNDDAAMPSSDTLADYSSEQEDPFGSDTDEEAAETSEAEMNLVGIPAAAA